MNHDHDPKNDSGSMLLAPVPKGGQHAAAGVTAEPPVRSELLPPTRSAIERFANRRARLQLCRGISLALVTFILGMLGLVLLDHFVRMSMPIRIATTLMVDGLAIAVAWFSGIQPSRQRDWTAIARSMEAATPPLRERLLSAVELEDPRLANGSIELRSSLQSGVAGQLSSVDIRHMLPWELLRSSLLTLAAACVVVALLSILPGLQMTRRLGRVFVPIAPIERASMTRLVITAPAPPTRSVAEGDLVAVVAEVSHLRGGGVTLEWQSDDGRKGTQPLAARDFNPLETLSPAGPERDSETSSTTASATPREHFSVNIPVATAPVHYRVLAGDAESLWHTLTPMPRPRIVSFEKHYRFPAYAKLSDTRVEEDFGDLEALVGTRAEVTVTFDQAVRAGDVWFGDSRSSAAGVPMQRVEDDPTRFRFQVAIKTPGSFRVDAISLQSELNNPFLPRFVIDPIFDRAPLAAWSAELPERQIVSPAAIMKLSGTVGDDLPMDRFLVQYSLDGGPIHERDLTLSPGVTEHRVEFDWDLMNLDGAGARAEPLPAGARLRTRLIAIDRANQRGESNWIDIYVAGEGFDPDRHEPLLALQAFTARLNAWWSDAQSLIAKIKQASNAAKKNPESEAYSPDPSFLTDLADLDSRWAELAGPFDVVALRQQQRVLMMNEHVAEPPLSLQRMVFDNNDAVASDRWSMLDRFVTRSLAELRDDVTRWQFAESLGETLSPRSREVAVNDVLESVRRWEGPAKQASDLASQLLGSELAVALQRDMDAVRQGAELLATEDSAIPIERLPGQADLLAERLRQIGSLIVTVESELAADTVGHLSRFRRFLDESSHRIDEVREKLQQDRNPNVGAEFRQSIAKILGNLQRQHLGAWMHGNTFNRINSSLRELAHERQHNHAAIGGLIRAGREHHTMVERSKQARQKQDSAEIAAANAIEKLFLSRFADRRNQLSMLYQRSEAREQTRADSQVKTASDFKLIRRVIEHVTENGYTSIGEETPDQVWERIEQAAMILEAGGQLARLASQVQDMVDRERFGKDRADRTVRQNLRLEHYQVVAETPINQFRAAEIDDAVFNNLNASRWDDDFTKAREWISRRRSELAPLISAAAPLQGIVARYQAAEATITEAMQTARATLRAFLPSTSELARQAAEEARRQADPKAQENAPETASKDRQQEEKPQDETAQQEAAAEEVAIEDVANDESAQDPTSNEQSDAEPPTPPSDQEPPQTQEEQLDQLQAKVDRVAENLVDRANDADLSDAAQRELARDADAALAQIQSQMEAVATPIREAQEKAKTSGNDPAQLNRPDVREQLEQLAETLQRTAEHFAAADAGQDLSQTRQQLRARAEADPDSAPLPDAIAAALENAMATNEIAQATPEELLNRLEKQLQRDPPMQEDLADISSQTVADAQQTVRVAAQQEKRLQRELEKADPELSEQKRVLRDQLKSLADQARAVNDHWIAAAENASGREDSQPTRDEIRQIRQEIREAAEEAEQVQNDDALLAEIQAVSQQLEATLAVASEQATSWHEQAEQASQNEAHENDLARQQLARQLESAQRRTQNEWIKSLQRQMQDWKRRGDEASRRVQQFENQKRAAEKQWQQAEKQLQANPDQEWAQRGEQQTQQKVAEATRAVEAAKQTQQSAHQAQQQADQRTDEARKQSVDKLEANDPTAEMLARASQTSRREMDRLAAELKELQQQAGAQDAPQPRASSLQQISREQHQVRETVRNAVEDLQRAARHEQRLGKSEVADQLSSTAGKLDNALQSPMQQAQQKLDQAAQAPDSAAQSLGKETGAQLGQAADQLAASAEALTGLAEAMATTSMPPVGESPSSASESTGTLAETDKSEKLARTLDELDQALNRGPSVEAGTQEQSAAAQNAEGQSPDGQSGDGADAAGQNGDGQSPQGQAGEGNGQQQSPTAGQASPTLAGAAEQAIRRLAAQRQQQLHQIASAGQPQSSSASDGQPPSDQPNDPNSPDGPSSSQAGTSGTQSGESSHMPDGGLLSLDDEGRSGGDWGLLRERKSDDMIQDRKTSVPLNYRPAIEAYFQAIAAEAARGAPGETPRGAAVEDSR